MTRIMTEFFEKMLALFPGAGDQYEKMKAEYGEILETVILEDAFFPCIRKMLQNEDDISLIHRAFDFFEEVCGSDDPHLLNVFTITILECLGNDKSVLRVARKYMGTKTYLLQIEADRSLGR